MALLIGNSRYLPGLLCAVLLSASAATLHAQELVLERQVVGSTGYSMQVGHTIFQYTAGEAVVATLMESPLLLTQGFQQPEVTVIHDIPQLPYLTDFILFPNPASSYTTIRFNLFAPGNVRLMLVNNAGQVVYSEDRNVAAGLLEYRVPLEQYASGLYYVVLSVDSSRKYTEKLIIQ
ncbi:T9SS type A sorting domain-containing protein [Parapedobacter sp. 10938]|uniref:T9SS type A sorting domain-containing protein n=1 Tax=Parapedobacter flavus TaxID=3110225 RepID=UPI002DBF1699|nr:T9SS type A sorting domain-containing protein [Parapedobacter sp. 10938]MEC3880793.1 T9SS type A sorting domain-containing protein [Parapedobacter sp. 10938]